MRLVKRLSDISVPPFVVLMFIILFVGACESPKQQFNGSVKIYKTNGQVTRVEFDAPDNFVIYNRDDVDSVIAEMDSLLIDLKYARDSMTVVEPKVVEPPTTSEEIEKVSPQ